MDAEVLDPDTLLTPAEVAAILYVDPKTVTRWAKAGKLSSFRTPGGHRRFLKSDILALITDPDHGRCVLGPFTAYASALAPAPTDRHAPARRCGRAPVVDDHRRAGGADAVTRADVARGARDAAAIVAAVAIADAAAAAAVAVRLQAEACALTVHDAASRVGAVLAAGPSDDERESALVALGLATAVAAGVLSAAESSAAAATCVATAVASAAAVAAESRASRDAEVLDAVPPTMP